MANLQGGATSGCQCMEDGNNGVACSFAADNKCSFIPLEWGRYCAYEAQFIEERYNDLLGIYNKLRSLDPKKRDSYKLVKTVLWEICGIYANDLKPVRLFHNSERGISKVRRAAFLARLVANHRPIALTQELSKEESQATGAMSVMKINERFALLTLCHFLTIRDETIRTLAIFPKVAQELMFIFTHRDPQQESLICIARLLDDAVKNHELHEQEKQKHASHLHHLQQEVAKLAERDKAHKAQIRELKQEINRLKKSPPQAQP